VLLRNPTTGIAGCCARAASGHAAAVLPSSVMNWRRPASSMGSSPEPDVPAYRRLRMHRKRPQVLGLDLNRSESSRWAACPSMMPAQAPDRFERHTASTRIVLVMTGRSVTGRKGRHGKSRPALRLTTGRAGPLGTTKQNPVGDRRSVARTRKELTHAFPEPDRCLHANDLLSARSVTLELKCQSPPVAFRALPDFCRGIISGRLAHTSLDDVFMLTP
jgi:hypothetical protein